jgi:uncharacterized protein DUF3108
VKSQPPPIKPRVTSPTPERYRLRRSPPSPHRLFRLLSLLAAFAVAVPAAAALTPQPHHLEYRVAWNGIPAAGATVEITPGELAGHESLMVEASAHTNAFVDLFWSFRGTVRATVLADGLTPLHFVYDRRMAGTPYVTSIDFDAQHAHSMYVRGERRRDTELDDAGIIDPITAVFRARLSGAQPGDTLRYDVWTGEKRYRVQLAVKAPEAIDVPAGHFSALPVVPAVWEIGDRPALDTRLRQATIWVADDPGRTLLRIRSELFIGAITLDLVKIEAAA